MLSSGSVMADHDPNRAGADEAPLDPAAERIRRRLARLLAGSLGVMLLGLIAVFAAIVYKVGGFDRPAASPPRAADSAAPRFEAPLHGRIALKPGSEIVALALDGGRALLQVREGAGAALLLVDLASGDVIGRWEIAAAEAGQETERPPAP